MRRLSLCLAALALSGCERGNDSPTSAGCALSAAREIVWSDESEPDSIVARADGPTCAQAVVTLILRDAQGNPLWAHVSTYVEMKHGGAPAEGAGQVDAEEMNTFLANWADLSQANTEALPEWRADAASLSASADTFAYDTPFERDVYESLRTRRLPMLCYAAAVEASTCLIIDPANDAPARIVTYGP